MVKKRFEFPVKVTKAYIDASGDKHVIAVASDTGIDWYNEKMDISALDDMVKYAKMTKENKPEEGLVDLLETHWSTFGIGFLVNGWINRNVETGFYEFVCDIKLKMSYAMAQELYDDVSKGVCDKQLSVGGYIDGDDGYDWEETEFVDDEGNTIFEWIGVIKGFILDHVACTREGWAANPRTGFLNAIALSLKDKEFQTKAKDWEDKRLSVTKNSHQKTWVEKVYSDIGKLVYRLFKEGDIDHMENLEKAKTLAGELKSLVPSLTKEQAAEILKCIVVESGEPSNPTESEVEVPKSLTIEEVVAKSTEIATELIEKAKGELRDELVAKANEALEAKFAEFSTKMSEVETKVETLVPLTEKMASLEAIPNSLEEVKKSFGDRLEVLESATPPSKGADGVELKTKEDKPVKTSVW